MTRDTKPEAFAKGFPPVHAENASLLILGSLPGRKSIQAHQYYAQPRNSFWRIMGALFGAGPELNYAARLKKLTDHSVALWDVLAEGQRPGSLDASIVKTTAMCNAFQGFFDLQPGICSIFFNGKMAAELYRRRVVPQLDTRCVAIPTVTLPSTSPAHAAVPYEHKLERWTEALDAGVGIAAG